MYSYWGVLKGIVKRQHGLTDFSFYTTVAPLNELRVVVIPQL